MLLMMEAVWGVSEDRSSVVSAVLERLCGGRGAAWGVSVVAIVTIAGGQLF